MPGDIVVCANLMVAIDTSCERNEEKFVSKRQIPKTPPMFLTLFRSICYNKF
jgi:hypothetical protein